jgi:ABC-type branched-subunit amino acid transport system substrate-binding protein
MLRAITAVFGLLAAVAVQAQALAVGTTLLLSGPQAAYGRGLQHGAQLAVDRANAAGGVNGRLLALVVLDDQGDAQRAATNARQLLERGVVAITGVHGAPATLAVAEAIAPGGAPQAALVAPATGAESLRDPPRPGVFHLRAGVAAEASAAMLHLDTVDITRYTLVSQAGPLGTSALERLTLELVRIATRPLASERLADGVTPEEVKRLMAKVCALGPEALVLATDAVQAAGALAAARSQLCAAQYFVFSEAGAALAERPPGAAGAHPMAGLLVTQVVPHPGNLHHPLVAEYRRALGAQRAPEQGSCPSLEGDLGARVVQEALRAGGREAGRACLLQTLGTRTLELAGLKVQFGSAQRQPRPFVEITLLDSDGRFRR